MPNKFLTYNGKEFEEALGFNMHEMDMRHYDPAIARWVVQDPVTHHSLSPYNAFDNNPVFWSDPSGADAQFDIYDQSNDGDNIAWVLNYSGDSASDVVEFNNKVENRSDDRTISNTEEPVRSAAGTIENAIKFIKESGATTVEEIYDLFAKTREDGSIEGFVRYVYTEGRGWIDLRHFFGTLKHGEIAMDALEITQRLKKYPSAYSYEDLPSNDFAGDSYSSLLYKTVVGEFKRTGVTSYKKEFFSGEKLFNKLLQIFNAAGATNPHNAPNYALIPASKTRPYGQVPQNFSEKPYHLNNFPVALTSLKIINEQKKKK